MVTENITDESISIIKAEDIKDITQEFKYVISGKKIGSIKTLTDEHKKMIDNSIIGNITLFSWIEPILKDIDSSWAKEFLIYWSK